MIMLDLVNRSFGSGLGRLSLGRIKFGSFNFGSGLGSVRVKFGLIEFSFGSVSV